MEVPMKKTLPADGSNDELNAEVSLRLRLRFLMMLIRWIRF
jgi:hypothetical protein